FTGTGQDSSAAIRSVVATVSYPGRRAYQRRIHSVACPVLLIHGTGDRLGPVAAARAAVRGNPAWTLAEITGVGHVPQLEAPVSTARAVTGWLRAAWPGAAPPAGSRCGCGRRAAARQKPQLPAAASRVAAGSRGERHPVSGITRRRR